MARQRLCILGSTGSIGTSTLDVVARHPERFEVFGLSAYQRVDALMAQCLQWRPRFVVVPGPEQATPLRQMLRENGVPTEVPSQPAIPTFDDSNPNAYWDSTNPWNSTKVAGSGTIRSNSRRMP